MKWRLLALLPLATTVLLAGLLLLGPTAQSASAQDTEFGADPGAAAPAGETPAPVVPADAAVAVVPVILAVEVAPDQQAGYAIDNFFLFICAVLVLFMQAGFAMVEAGFNSSKHTVNILFKNSLDLCVGVLLYFVVGYNLMYPGDYTTWIADKNAAIEAGETFDEVANPAPWNGYIGGFTPGIPGYGADEPAAGALAPQVDFLFQVAFAATAATIVSGAVAGRMKFGAYMIYSAVITALIYPISGSWKWGLGWLNAMGFYDFAGSVVVHAVGGFAGLAGAIVLGPRLGRYTDDGRPIAIPGHSLPLATLGVFILLIGWFGFNPGSQLALYGVSPNETGGGYSDTVGIVMKVAVNTLLSAAAGGCVATFLSWILFGKPDLSMALNGMLAGLVGITANCDGVTNGSALIIGAVAGVIVVAGIILLDKLRIDDPVGAFPVHGLCGMWGCLAIPIFGDYGEGTGTWAAQITGTIAICAWSFFTMLVLFGILKAVGFLRVTPEEEERGLDISEHGMSAYST